MFKKLLEYPATTSATICFVALTTLFWVTGALWPTVLPDYASSRRQIIGMALMLILMPTYFVVAGFAQQRRSLDLVDRIRALLPDERYADEASATIRGALARVLFVGSIFGIAMGLYNANLFYAFFESTTPAIDITFAITQAMLWTMIGIVICQRVVVARAFDRIGGVIRFELFQLQRLRLFARSGMNDVLLTVGAVALSPLQALDAEFRWYNYSFALIVAFPTASTLIILPLRQLHRRIVQEKKSRLTEVEEHIAAACAGEAHEDLPHLEALLTHRDRLRDHPTWPFNTAFVYQLVVYLIIPPLAWAGAALVERFVTSLLN